MELMQYLLDTNIVIYYFNGLTNDERIDELLGNSFNISIITQIEFLGWSGFATDEHLYQKAQEFIYHLNPASPKNRATLQTFYTRIL
jgi:predicted nucleic acid-binding protein